MTNPTIAAVLKDAQIEPGRIDAVVLGNATAGGNPGRLVAMAAGLDSKIPALTIDRQCCSGLDAILIAAQEIATGGARIVLAGGAESLSNAPWRIAKPRSLHQLPHFLPFEPAVADGPGIAQSIEASEALATRLGIGRDRQDAFALQAHLKADAARSARQFVGEIVALRATAEETRDQSAIEPAMKDLARLPAFLPPDGTLTSGNTSALHDGAAFVVLVSEPVWVDLGQPPALRLVASAARGVDGDEAALAPAAAMKKMLQAISGFDLGDIGAIETSEVSAAQVIALAAELDIDPVVINPAGGAIVRGHPFGAAGAVIVVRLFTDLLRSSKSARYGAVTQGSICGLGVAALFEVHR